MTSKILIVGEAWGDNERRISHPFVGASGAELIQMLNESGIICLTEHDRNLISEFWRFGRDPRKLALLWAQHPQIALTNVFNIKPEPTNDIINLCGDKAEGIPGLPPLAKGKYVRKIYSPELDRLSTEARHCKPNLILALGNTPSWAIMRSTSISKSRGTVSAALEISPGVKVLRTYHPAAILRDWSLRHVTVLDLIKAKAEAEFPEIRRPQRLVYIEPSLEDLESFFQDFLLHASTIAFDIETSGDQITCIGFAPSTARALVIPFVDNRKPGGSYWQSQTDEILAWAFVRKVLDLPAKKVGQNTLYDIHFLWRQYGITVRNYEDDTMLLHHALQPESQKGLDFLGSVYTNEASWKLMRPRGKQTIKRDE